MTDLSRSSARYARAAAVLAPITLDQETADALAAVCRAHGVTRAAAVRALILLTRATAARDLVTEAMKRLAR